jgi:hypothetical protein
VSIRGRKYLDFRAHGNAEILQNTRKISIDGSPVPARDDEDEGREARLRSTKDTWTCAEGGGGPAG